MKTSEFKEKLMNLAGFFIGEGGEWTKISYNSALVAEIRKSNMPKVIFYSVPFRQMVDICLDYAETPLSEREEVKKYRVVLPDPSNNKDHVFALRKGYNGEAHIGWCHVSHLEDGLTESEINHNHAYLWRFAEEIKK